MNVLSEDQTFDAQEILADVVDKTNRIRLLSPSLLLDSDSDAEEEEEYQNEVVFIGSPLGLNVIEKNPPVDEGINEDEECELHAKTPITKKRFETNSKTDGERIIAASQPSIWMKEVSKVLGEEFKPQGYCVPKHKAPDMIIKAASLFSDQAKMISERLNVDCRIDNSKAKRMLNIEFRDPRKSVVEMAYSLIEHGILPKKSGYKGNSPPSKEIYAQYKKSKALFEKIISVENDEEKWIEALKETGDDLFVQQNVEFRLGRDMLNKKLWKCYIAYKIFFCVILDLY